MKKTNLKIMLVAAGALCGAVGAACDALDVFIPLPEFGGPAGVLDGAVTYSGPLPCTREGHVVGAGVILGFDINLLPPPEGLGTTAGGLDVIPGDELFEGVRDQLYFDPNGNMWCPDENAPPVTVSGNWAMGPFPAGRYQVRGFYDLDGDFDPAFSISLLPSQGDVGGGAIDNVAEVLLGAAPRYRVMTLGQDDGTGKLVIPDQGSRVTGIAATFGLELPLERPIFYPKAVLDENAGNTDPAHVVMPSDFQLAAFGADSSFIRIVLGAGVPDEERATALASPFNMHVAPKSPCYVGAPIDGPCFFYSQQDVNQDGVFDSKDTIPEGLVLSLFPAVIFAKLPEGKRLGNQTAPTVILQGLTLYKSLIETVGASPNMPDAQPEVLVGLRPAVLCLDPLDLSKEAVLVTTHPTYANGAPVLSDEESVKAALSKQFSGRPVRIVYGCLPEGELAMNIIYDTGQAWTVPNETAVCADSEPLAADGKSCGKRPILASQGAVLTIGKPTDAAYCVANPTPAACLPQ